MFELNSTFPLSFKKVKGYFIYKQEMIFIKQAETVL